MDDMLDRLMHRRVLRRWSRAAAEAESAEPEDLRALRTRARQIRREIDRVIHVADLRLGLPMIGSEAMPRPIGTDWSWRPDLWRAPIAPSGRAGVETRTAFAPGVTVFHDCALNQLTIRQLRNGRDSDLAPFGLAIDILQFEGSFLSLAIDLPKAAAEGLRRRHIIRLDALIEAERPVRALARLNIRHGPNTEPMLRELAFESGRARPGEVSTEFDLAYGKINEKRVDSAWIDLILEAPALNRIVIRDLTLGRRPRAEL